uniref:MI domain-containing protein n=1 Tax=Arion vulgaris TaxID=1028688 RepID=A0A0B7ALD3_9EUPU
MMNRGKCRMTHICCKKQLDREIAAARGSPPVQCSPPVQGSPQGRAATWEQPSAQDICHEDNLSQEAVLLSATETLLDPPIDLLTGQECLPELFEADTILELSETVMTPELSQTNMIPDHDRILKGREDTMILSDKREQKKMSSVNNQRKSWKTLKQSIKDHINVVNAENINRITRNLFQNNLKRGRGLLARSIIQAQAASPTLTHVYAALVVTINTKLPKTGELILRRLILMFRQDCKRDDKAMCLSTTTFIAHLVNLQVAHEVLAFQMLRQLLLNPTNGSVEVAVDFLKECGLKLTAVSPQGINSIFEDLRKILHKGQIETRVQKMVKAMVENRTDEFKDHPAVLSDLDLVGIKEFNHVLQLEDTIEEDKTHVFKEDSDFEENEEEYMTWKSNICFDESSDEESSESSESESDDEEKEKTRLLLFTQDIKAITKASVNEKQCAYKLLNLKRKPDQEVMMCSVILDCCEKLKVPGMFYALVAKELCQQEKKFIALFQNSFFNYKTIHNVEAYKIQNMGKFFAHLLYTDAISWEVFKVVTLTKETSENSKTFLKILFQALSKNLGLFMLNKKLKDPTLSLHCKGFMARDNLENNRLRIEFFTKIGLGALMDDLREHLKATTKQIAQQNLEADQANIVGSSSSSNPISVSLDSDEPSKKRRKSSAPKTKTESGEKEFANIRNGVERPSERNETEEMKIDLTEELMKRKGKVGERSENMIKAEKMVKDWVKVEKVEQQQ